MKFNFGTGLILFFTLWAAGIIYLVVLSSGENTDLVAPDYYNREVAFQSRIDKEKNAAHLSQLLQLNFNRQKDSIVIQFPDDFLSYTLTGNIHFFKPDDAALDFDVKIDAESPLQQKIPSEKMRKGLWRAQVDWSCRGKNYYEEKNFMIE